MDTRWVFPPQTRRLTGPTARLREAAAGSLTSSSVIKALTEKRGARLQGSVFKSIICRPNPTGSSASPSSTVSAVITWPAPPHQETGKVPQVKGAGCTLNKIGGFSANTVVFKTRSLINHKCSSFHAVSLSIQTNNSCKWAERVW